MVLPDHLVEPVLRAKGEREAWAGVTDQLTLADFIESGHYDRHIRRSRQRYRDRRDRLVALLARRAPHVAPAGIAAGLHAVLRLPPGSERSVVKAAAWQRIAVDGLAGFGTRPPGCPRTTAWSSATPRLPTTPSGRRSTPSAASSLPA
ncbi:hypothetical protein SALBM217S_09027 [Streptomyces griseoloalbus]